MKIESIRYNDSFGTPYRRVKDSTWRKIMAVVRAADYWDKQGVVMPEVGALHDHLERKRKK